MAWRVRASPLQLVRAYGEVVLHDLMPTFSNMNERAEQVAAQEYERLAELPAGDDWNGDMGALAEAANDQGVEFYETLSSMRQSVLNLFAVGLFHLLEQQVADLCNDGAFAVPPPDDTNLVGEVSQWYSRHFQLDLRRLGSWNAIDELRVVANVVKHAEGNSAERLRARRPQLLCYPGFQGAHLGMFDATAHVARPLAGDDLYVTPQILQEYVDAASSFLREIEVHFQQHRDEYYPVEGAV